LKTSLGRQQTAEVNKRASNQLTGGTCCQCFEGVLALKVRGNVFVMAKYCEFKVNDPIDSKR